MAKKYGTNFTEGNIPRQMLMFAIPFMGANMLQVVYSMVDMMIVGHFISPAGISAVSAGSQITNLLVMFCAGFEAGAQIYLSQLIGAGKKEKLNRAIGTITTSTAIFGVVAMLLALLGGRLFLGLINTPAEAMEMGVDYLLITGGLIIFTFGYNLVSTLQRAQGDSKHPLIFIGIATVINVVLDLLFTGYLGWGTRGAAWATVIGQAVSFLIAVLFLYRHRDQFGFDFKPESFRIDMGIFTDVFKLASANILQYAIIYFSMIAVTSMVNKLGVAASATLAVGLKIDDVMSKVTVAMRVACTTMVGQNFAARKFDRCRQVVRSAWVYTAICYVVFAYLYINHAQQLFGAFTSDPEVLELSSQWIRASICGYLGFVIMRGANGLVQGIGFYKFALVISMFDAFVLRVGMAYLLGTVLGFGLFGYFLGYLTACYGSAIPALIYYLSGAWTKREAVV